MPVSIVSNLASQYSQQAIQARNLGVLNSTQKLTSGQRVYSAAEDAAALAVGSGLKIENATLAKARLNATSGISMLQVTDGALGQLQDIIVRMKTLATQASSGQNGAQERAAIGLEFGALKQEINRISSDTEFNGVAMLTGAPRYVMSQADSLMPEGIRAQIDPEVVGEHDATYRLSYDSTTETMTVTRIEGGAATSQSIDLTALLDGAAGVGQNMTGAEQVEARFQSVGLKVTLNAMFDRTLDKLPVVTDSTPADITVDAPAFVPATTGVTYEALEGMALLTVPYNAATGDLNVTFASLGGALSLNGVAGLRMSVDGGAVGASGAGTGNLVGADYVDFYVDTASGFERIGRLTTGAGGFSTTADSAGTMMIPLGQGLTGAEYQDNFAARSLTYAVGTGVIQGQDLLVVDIPAVTTEALGIDVLEVNTQFAADATITALTMALDRVTAARSLVGAQQARLEQVAGSIAVRTENNELARSALLDVDVADEITELTSNQAMLEVGVSMLSQTNRLPQILLQMLRA
jgi:flagellin